MKLDPYLTPYVKINSKWSKDLRHKIWNCKPVEENRGKVLDIGLGNNSFRYDTQSTGNKSKNRQVRLNQTDKHTDGNNQQSERATNKIGENICKLYIWERLNLQNTWGTQTTQYQSINNQIRKQAKNLNRYLYKENIPMLAGTWKDFSFCCILFSSSYTYLTTIYLSRIYFIICYSISLSVLMMPFFWMYPQVVFTSFSIENNVDSLLNRATVISTDLGFKWKDSLMLEDRVD